ncbi:MAG: LPS export ABC transporter periplasmic protein LptC [Bacillota bacterium]
MKINKNTVVLIAVAVLLTGSGLYYFLRDVPEPPPTVAEQGAEEGELQFLGTGLSETKDGKIQWEVQADQIQAGLDKKIVTMQGIRAKIYEHTGGQGIIQITANQGRMENTEKVLTLEGNITALSEKGTEFAGNVIKWFMNEQRFTGEGGIRYRQTDVTITGDRMEVEQNLNTVRVTGNARAELRR